MELTYHIVDLPNVTLQIVLLLLDTLVPDLGKESLDVGLCLARVGMHFKVCPSVLTGENIRLHLHDCTLLLPELLLDDIPAPVCLEN